VAGVDIDGDRARAVAAEIRATSGEAIALDADLRSWADAQRAVDAAVEAVGPVDVVVDVIGEIRWGRWSTSATMSRSNSPLPCCSGTEHITAAWRPPR